MRHNHFSITVQKSMREYACAHDGDCHIPKKTHYFKIKMDHMDFDYPRNIKLCSQHTLSEVVAFAQDGRALDYLEKEKIIREEEKKKKQREKNRRFNRFEYLDLD